MRVSNRFEDPATGETYDWHVNHAEEEDSGRTRNIDLSGNTSGLGLVRQQGEKPPISLRWRGSILHNAQLVEMWRWFEKCEDRTIRLRDFAGDYYEGTITAFQPQRKRGENRNDRANAPLHYWSYTLEFQVLRVLDGALADAGVTP